MLDARGQLKLPTNATPDHPNQREADEDGKGVEGRGDEEFHAPFILDITLSSISWPSP